MRGGGLIQTMREPDNENGFLFSNLLSGLEQKFRPVVERGGEWGGFKGPAPPLSCPDTTAPCPLTFPHTPRDGGRRGRGWRSGGVHQQLLPVSQISAPSGGAGPDATVFASVDGVLRRRWAGLPQTCTCDEWRACTCTCTAAFTEMSLSLHYGRMCFPGRTAADGRQQICFSSCCLGVVSGPAVSLIG